VTGTTATICKRSREEHMLEVQMSQVLEATCNLLVTWLTRD